MYHFPCTITRTRPGLKVSGRGEREKKEQAVTGSNKVTSYLLASKRRAIGIKKEKVISQSGGKAETLSADQVPPVSSLSPLK